MITDSTGAFLYKPLKFNKMNALILERMSSEELVTMLINKITPNIDELMRKSQAEAVMDSLLTVDETCQLLRGISRVTLDSYCKKGILRKWGIEGRVYFKYHEVLDALVALS